MSRKKYNVLFLCTGNSARSILAEATLNVRGGDRFKAYSAGSMPTGKVNPFAIERVQQLGYPAENLRSKSWEEFEGDDATRMDIVITVCDNAAGEVCPIWPGHPITAHWGFEDPAAAEGSDNEKRAAFQAIHKQIEEHVVHLLKLPLDTLDATQLATELRKIGERDQQKN